MGNWKSEKRKRKWKTFAYFVLYAWNIYDLMQFVAYFWSTECPSGPSVLQSVCPFDCPFGWQATVLASVSLSLSLSVVLGPIWFGQPEQNVDPWSDVSANLWNMLLMHLLPWLLNLCGKRLWLRLRLRLRLRLGFGFAGKRVLGTCFWLLWLLVELLSAYGKSPL